MLKPMAVTLLLLLSLQVANAQTDVDKKKSEQNECALVGGRCLDACRGNTSCEGTCRQSYKTCLQHPETVGQSAMPPSQAQGGPHPNDQDALQCVSKFFGQNVEMGPAVMSCNDFARLESVRIVDRKNNGSTVDAIAEITLRAVQQIGGASMAASMCTGTNWKNNVPANGRMILTKVLTFQVFSTRAICMTQSLQPLVSATGD